MVHSPLTTGFQINLVDSEPRRSADEVATLAAHLEKTLPVEGALRRLTMQNISRLKAAGLVRREPYRAIFLTDAGRELAEACRRRHRIVVAFLLSLGIDEETAERDAEGIEHHVSGTTLEAFEQALVPSQSDT